MYTDNVTDSRSAKGGKKPKHLVVAITNKYKGSPPDDQLDGIEKDREKLDETFGNNSKIDLIQLKNCSKNSLKKELFQHIRQHRGGSLESTFIIFSGHGGILKTNNRKLPYIIAEDGKKVNLRKFFTSIEKEIGSDVPKFFLIDACRNVHEDERKQNKGGHTNSLYAYATGEDESAWVSDTGSDWIQEVANQFQESPRKTVVEILKVANANVMQNSTDTYKQNPVLDQDQLKKNGRNLRLGDLGPG